MLRQDSMIENKDVFGCGFGRACTERAGLEHLSPDPDGRQEAGRACPAWFLPTPEAEEQRLPFLTHSALYPLGKHSVVRLWGLCLDATVRFLSRLNSCLVSHTWSN